MFLGFICQLWYQQSLFYYINWLMFVFSPRSANWSRGSEWLTVADETIMIVDIIGSSRDVANAQFQNRVSGGWFIPSSSSCTN